MAQQQSILRSARKQWTAYTWLYNRWLLITVLLLTLDGCFSMQRRLFSTFGWQWLTFTQTVPYIYPVASLKRHIAYCDDNMHKHEPNVSTPKTHIVSNQDTCWTNPRQLSIQIEPRNWAIHLMMGQLFVRKLFHARQFWSFSLLEARLQFLCSSSGIADGNLAFIQSNLDAARKKKQLIWLWLRHFLK